MDSAVARAMREVPRTGFLPEHLLHRAGEDRPLPIGPGQTSSQPSTVQTMLELLEAGLGHNILDVGSGSAWTTALLGVLTGPTGRVVGVELVQDIAAWGAANLAAAQLPWARVEVAVPGVLGWPDDAPYDRILVSAMARALPQELLAQLVVGGLMVVPVAGRMLRVCRMAGSAPTVEQFGYYRFVPLR